MKLKLLIPAFVISLVVTSKTQQMPVHTSTHGHPGEASMHNQHGFENHGQSVFTQEFENQLVQVVRIRIGPREKIPMHEITPRVIVLLTDQHLKMIFPNGESREEHHKAGESMWVSGGRHSGENLSDQPIEFIAVIPRQK